MNIPFLNRTRMKRDDFIILCTTLSWMHSAGLSIRDGVVELLGDKHNKMNRNALEILRDELDSGKKLPDIMKDHEDVFGEGYWRQLEAAERTGKVPECLMRIAEQVRNDGDLLGKVRGALLYPSFILLLALAAGYYMFTSVVPEMGTMMMEFDVEMPPLTKVMIAVADFLIANGIWVLASIIVFVIVVHYLLTKPFRMQWHEVITKMPVVGKVSVNMNYSLAYLLLNDMIENGANIVEALRVAAGSCTNAYIRKELLDTADTMDREGISLTEGLTETNTMPSDDKLMLQIGQRTGREMELLPDLSSRRRKAAYDSVNAVMELLPTIVLLGVSGIVAVMVVSIYMPMISMATDIG